MPSDILEVTLKLNEGLRARATMAMVALLDRVVIVVCLWEICMDGTSLKMYIHLGEVYCKMLL